jgi:polyphenol oxidase
VDAVGGPASVGSTPGDAAAGVRFTDRSHGDLAVHAAGVDGRRRAVVDLPWTWLHQVHGADVVVVRDPGAHAGTRADAAVTDVPGAVVAVQTADCAPVALLAPGAVGVVHAGWRGLVAGVLPAAVAALRQLSDGPVRAVLGPCIRTGCYEFSHDALDGAAAVLGDGVRGRTATGRPALDLAAGVRASLRASGVVDLVDVGVCTACSEEHFSHRARGDVGRQSLVAWLELGS